MKKNANNSKWPPALIFLLLLPLPLFWLVAASAIDYRQKIHSNRAHTELQFSAEKILNHLEPTLFLENYFHRFIEEVFKPAQIPENLEAIIAKYTSAEIDFVPYIFSNGKLITPPGFTRDYDLPIVELWHHIINPEYTRFQRIKAKARSWFGPVFSYSRLKKMPDTIIEFSGKTGKGAVMLHLTDADSGALLVCWQLPGVTTLAEKIPPELKENLKLSIKSLDADDPEFSGEIAEAKKRTDLLWLRKVFNGTSLLFTRNLPELDYRGFHLSLKLALLLIATAFLLTLHLARLENPLQLLSIKGKLISLAIYAIIFPLLGFGYFGWKLIIERESLLKQQAINDCISGINEVDVGFEREKEEILAFYRSLHEPFLENRSKPETFQWYRSLEDQQLINWIEVRDLQTEVVVTTQAESTAQQIGVVGRTFARLGITNFLSHRVGPQHKLTPSAAEVLIQEFLESPFGGWARIFESPDELSDVTFGGYDLLWYWNVLPENSANAAFIVIDNHLHWAIKNYLERVLVKRVGRGHAALRLLALSHESPLTIPAGETLSGDLGSFFNQIKRNSQPQTAAINWNDKIWLAAGAPCKRLKNHILICLYPYQVIEDQITGLRRDIFWAVAFTLLLALLTGLLFSRLLIEPILQLQKGVTAIRKKDVAFRLENFNHDELGQLSKQFNQTIETLADIISAQKIQKQMIPEQAPALPGFATAVSYLPADDLGGDYCDIQPVNEKFCLFAIGDVTGHGVSSALVTAMAKAVVTDFVIAGETDPTQIMICLNEMLFTQFNRKKCMTMFLALLDLESGKMACSNAGHPMPLLLRQNQRLPLLPLSHPPLGFSTRNQVFPRADVLLEPGDRLLLFTDILIECRGHDGEAIGSSGLAKLCLAYNSLAPAEMSEKIIDKVKKLAGKKLDDDLTMIIISRNSD